MEAGSVLTFWMEGWTHNKFVYSQTRYVLSTSSEDSTLNFPFQSLRGKLRRLFKTLYPWINLSFESWLLVYNIAYLFDRTPFYRPWLSWIGVDLRRLGIEDFVSNKFLVMCVRRLNAS
jgi:hypothetical protein